MRLSRIIVKIIKSVHRVFCVWPPSSLPKEYFENVDFWGPFSKSQCTINDPFKKRTTALDPLALSVCCVISWKLWRFWTTPISSSCRVCNGIEPPHRSILHFRNVIYARSLPEMFAARHAWYGSGRIWLRCTYSFYSPGSPTDVSLPG